MSSYRLSEEQEQIIQYAIQGFNLKIIANAGASKSTTCIEVAKRFADIPELNNKNIALFTFSGFLKREMKVDINIENKKRMVEGKIPINLTSFSYGSFSTSIYNPEAYDTKGMISIIEKNTNPLPGKFIKYDVVILDEKQDDNIYSYRFQLKFLLDIFIVNRTYLSGQLYGRSLTQHELNSCFPQLICLGDPFQLIFEGMGADERFLTLCNELYVNSRIWQFPMLTVSFRFHRNIATLVNRLGKLGVPLQGNPNSPVHKILYYKYNPKIQDGKSNSKLFYDIITNYLLKPHIKYGDILLVAQNTSNNQLINDLVELLVLHEIPVYRPSKYESSSLDSPAEGDDENEVMNNKIQILSYTKCKGLSRKVVILMDFDSSYFDIYNPDINSTKMPNAHYVGLTRATKHLILCQNAEYSQVPYMPDNFFINNQDILEIKQMDLIQVKSKKPRQDKPQVVTITKFLEFIPYYAIEICDLLLSNAYEEYNNLTAEMTEEEIDDIAKTTGLSNVYSENIIDNKVILEPVSMINQLAIISCLEYYVTGKSPYIYRPGWNKDYFLVNNPPIEYFKDEGITAHVDKITGINYFLDSIREPFIVKDGIRYYSPIYEVFKFTNQDGSPLILHASDFLKMANVYYSNINGRKESLYQINHYNWLNSEAFKYSIENLYNIGVNNNSIFNISLRYKSPKFTKYIITTTLSLMCENQFYELKILPNNIITDIDRIEFIFKLFLFFNQHNKFYEDQERLPIRGDIIDFINGDTIASGEVMNYISETEIMTRVIYPFKGNLKTTYIPANISTIQRNYTRNQELEKYNTAYNYSNRKYSELGGIIETRVLLNVNEGRMKEKLDQYRERPWYSQIVQILNKYRDVNHSLSINAKIVNMTTNKQNAFHIPLFLMEEIVEILFQFKNTKNQRSSDMQFIEEVTRYRSQYE